MSHKYSINDILDAVQTINPIKKSNKKFANEEILDAVKELYQSNQIEKRAEPKKPEVVPTNIYLKKNFKVKTKIEKKKKIFTSPLLLTNIIKYEPIKSKALFLKKLHNSNLKIIAMKITTQASK